MSTASYYATPPTFMEALLECSAYIERQRHDETATKADVLDAMERRVSLLVGKMAAHPSCASFAVFPPDP